MKKFKCELIGTGKIDDNMEGYSCCGVAEEFVRDIYDDDPDRPEEADVLVTRIDGDDKESHRVRVTIEPVMSYVYDAYYVDEEAKA